MRKVYENVLYRYEYTGQRNVFGRPVYAAYRKDGNGKLVFVGYRERRTKRELTQLQKQYHNKVGIPVWQDCPEWTIHR